MDSKRRGCSFLKFRRYFYESPYRTKRRDISYSIFSTFKSLGVVIPPPHLFLIEDVLRRETRMFRSSSLRRQTLSFKCPFYLAVYGLIEYSLAKRKRKYILTIAHVISYTESNDILYVPHNFPRSRLPALRKRILGTSEDETTNFGATKGQRNKFRIGRYSLAENSGEPRYRMLEVGSGLAGHDEVSRRCRRRRSISSSWVVRRGDLYCSRME